MLNIILAQQYAHVPRRLVAARQRIQRLALRVGQAFIDLRGRHRRDDQDRRIRLRLVF